MDLAASLQQGLTAQRAGDLAKAATIYRKILQKAPTHPDASYLLGLIVQKQGGHEEAIALFEKTTRGNPKLSRAHLQRGFSLNAVGRDGAESAFRAAIKIESGLAEAHHQLGNILRRQNQLSESLSSLREATRLAPKETIFWLSHGTACRDAGKWDEAAESFQQAAQLSPTLPEAHTLLGQIFLAQQKMEPAREQFLETLRLKPDSAEAHHDLGRLCAEEGLHLEAAEYFRHALALKPAPETASNLLFLLHYLTETEPAQHFTEHQRWAGWFEQPVKESWQPHLNDADPGRRLRVGYVSPDLRDHPVVSFIGPILRHHRREHVEVFAYANVKTQDAVSERLRGWTDQWRNIFGMAPANVADQVRRDGIDILIDLAGHTTDHSLPVFALKPAPVQITWIGYPNTTGLTAMDYRLTEPLSDPPGQTERWHSEELIRLPETFSCYEAPPESPAMGPLPALKNGYVTFGSFNNFRKLSPPTIQLWARLLREMPTARLLLKSQGLGRPGVQQWLYEQFVRAGIPATRLDLRGAGLPKDQHMGLYNQVDVCLDPFPYNGTTTTCDALWMGVPVVTLIGRTHVARVGLSLVTNLGFPEWATNSENDYVTRCKELAGNLPELAAIRERLRQTMSQSPLCDAPRFIEHLESVYRKVWERRCRHQAAT
ncbi:MAG TPA: tetratricopeptide repeat protein [Candidatus Sulfotelmatobacter sp.]|jgi:protein O-GlcNAc transferase|nr:tetratricopeptide repeat protein [Candidatus Sulfotelmatobacter sp.]